MAAITLDIGGNTRQLDRDIQKTVSKVYSINLKTKGDQPLGRITGQVNEFTKSLDASNARVIAFGASAGIIYGLEKAFSALVSSTIEVQKSLQDINVILNVSASELQKFGGELFNIAKNTGQGFQEVAKAATEFSRQGLGVAETLKRTNEALILSRLSGLDAAKSVEALTAAVNSFASQAVTASEVVNKFANVDAAFAVSSADLAEAISRVGSSAAQSGVSLNELIAIVTSAQQTTARGGAVIGNSFKTIFTRLERGKVQDLLGSLGISTTDSTGQLKSTIQLLQDLGKVYDTLGAQQQAYVAEQVGGVFQINILKAALADLGKEYSIYNSALNVAASSTDEAVKRNDALNKTYAAQINTLKQNATQLAATAGNRLLGPAFERVVGGANKILGGVNESEGTGVGSALGKGIIDGLAQFIAGPGLAIIGGVLLKLFRDLGKFATGSVQQLLGLNQAAVQQQSLQQSINQILQKNPQLLELALKGEQGLNAAANSLLTNLQKQTVELQKQAAVAAQISKAFYGAGVRVTGGVPIAPTQKTGKAAGYIPNFVSDKKAEEAQAIALGATPSVRAHMSQGTIGGHKFVMNNQETEFPGVGRNGDSMVIPHYVAKGFIPNFAVQSVKPYIDYAKSLGLAVGSPNSIASKEVVKLANKTKNGQLRSETEIKDDIKQLAAARKGTVGNINALKGIKKFAYMYAAQGGEDEYSGKIALTKDSKPLPFSFSTIGLKKPFSFEDNINKKITPVLDDLAAQLIPKNSKILKVNPSDFNEYIDKSAFNQLYGRLFEAVVNRAIGKSVRGEAGTARFEFFQSDLSGQYSQALMDVFNSPSLPAFAAADLKFRKPSPESGSVLSFVKKMAAQSGIPYDKTARIAARGFIPNFASTNRGVPVSQIRAHFDKGGNPIAVTNTRDEPNGLKDAIGRERKGIGMYSRGFVPNFAEEPTSASSAIGALSIQLVGLSYVLSGTTNQYKQNLQALGDSAKGVKKFGAAADAYGSAIAIGAPILAATIKNAISQTSPQGRANAAAVTGAGQALSLGATGAQLGMAFGPYGALAGGAIGLTAGTVMAVKNYYDELGNTLPEAIAAHEKASQELTKFNDASARLTTASENLKNALSEAVPNPQKVKQAQDEYAATLAEFSPEDQARIVSKQGDRAQQAEIAKIRKEKELAEKNTARVEDVTKLLQEGDKNLFRARYKSTETEKAQVEKNKESFLQSYLGMALQGKQGKEALPIIQNLDKFREDLNAIAIADNKTFSPEDKAQSLKTILERALPETPEKGAFIESIFNYTKQGIENLSRVVTTLTSGVLRTKFATEDAVKSGDRYSQGLTDENNRKLDAIKANEAMIKSLQKNIDLAKKSIATEQKNRSFAKETSLADEFTRPTELVSKITGEKSRLTDRYSLKEEMARISFDYEKQLDDITSGLYTDINKAVIDPILEKINTTREVPYGLKSPTDGKPSPAMDDFISTLKTEIIDKQNLNPDSLRTLLTPKLNAIGLYGEAANAKLDEIASLATSADEKRVAESRTLQEKFVSLAKETTQKDLISAVEQAQKFGGGVSEFLNQPKPGESSFDKVETAIRNISVFYNKIPGLFDYFPGTDQYRYQNRESIAAREKMLPQVGSSALGLLTSLQTLTGYEPDPNSKLFKEAVGGLSQNLKNNIDKLIKLFEGKPKDELQQEVLKALKEQERLGGTDLIAELQLAQQLGSANIGPLLEKLANKIQTLSDSPEKQQLKTVYNQLSDDVLMSSDPTVKAINITNNILKQILAKGFQEKYTPIRSYKAEVETQAKGFLPGYNEESRAINRGVGGAKPGDRPQFIPNLNGSPTFINSGEKLIDNFGGSGQTAVLTRDMQKAMGMAKGFIPNFADKDENAKFGRTIGIEDGLDSLIPFFEDIWNRFQNSSATKLTSIPNTAANIFKSGLVGAGAEASTQYALDNLFHGGKKSQNLYTESLEKVFSTAIGGFASGLSIGKGNPLAGAYGMATSLAIGAGKNILDTGLMIPDLISATNETIFAEAQVQKLKEKILKSGKLPPGTTLDNLAGGFIPNFAETLPIDDYLEELAKNGGISGASLGMMKTNNPSGFIDTIKAILEKLKSSPKNMAQGFIPNGASGLTEEYFKPGYGYTNKWLTEIYYLKKEWDKKRQEVKKRYNTAVEKNSLPYYKAGQSFIYDNLDPNKRIKMPTYEDGSAPPLEINKISIWDELKSAYIKEQRIRDYSREDAVKKWESYLDLLGDDHEFDIIDHIKKQENFDLLKDGIFDSPWMNYIVKKSRDPKKFLETVDLLTGKINETEANMRGLFMPEIRSLDDEFVLKLKKYGYVPDSDNQILHIGTSFSLSDGYSMLDRYNQDYRNRLARDRQAEIDKKTEELRQFNENFRTQNPDIARGVRAPGDPRGTAFSFDESGTLEQQTKTPRQFNSITQSYEDIPRAERGISPGQILNELDAQYELAARNSKSSDILYSIKQTQQRYHALYNAKKYAELYRFYQTLKNQTPGKFSVALGDRATEAIKYGRFLTDNELNFQKFLKRHPEFDPNDPEKIKWYEENIGPTKANGFIPNFAYKDSVMDLEKNLSGNKAIYSTNPFPHIRNSSQPTFASAIADHGGLGKALNDSMRNQKSAGLMSRGYIPNFAASDQSFTQVESSLNTNTNTLQKLLNGIEKLNNSLSNFSNSRQNQNINQQNTNQSPNITTTNNAPVNLVVNANNDQGDIGVEIRKVIENSIPNIVSRVRAAMGEKVPPSKP